MVTTRKWLIQIDYQTLCEEHMVESLTNEMDTYGGVMGVLEMNNQQNSITISPCTSQEAVKFEAFLNRLKKQHKIKFWSRANSDPPRKKRKTTKTTAAVKAFVRSSVK